MIASSSHTWTCLKPAVRSPKGRALLVDHARALARASRGEEPEQAIDELRAAFVDRVRSSARAEASTVLAMGLVIADLAVQRWQLRVRKGLVEARPPSELSEDRTAEKERIRRQELVKRNAQLRQEPVQKFLRMMER